MDEKLSREVAELLIKNRKTAGFVLRDSVTGKILVLGTSAITDEKSFREYINLIKSKLKGKEYLGAVLVTHTQTIVDQPERQ